MYFCEILFFWQSQSTCSPPAMSHSQEAHTACFIQNGHQGPPKWLKVSKVKLYVINFLIWLFLQWEPQKSKMAERVWKGVFPPSLCQLTTWTLTHCNGHLSCQNKWSHIYSLNGLILLLTTKTENFLGGQDGCKLHLNLVSLSSEVRF